MRPYPDYGWERDDDLYDHESFDDDRWKTDPAWWQAALDHATAEFQRHLQEVEAWWKQWQTATLPSRRMLPRQPADGEVWPNTDPTKELEFITIRLHEEMAFSRAQAALIKLHELGAPEPVPAGLSRRLENQP